MQSAWLLVSTSSFESDPRDGHVLLVIVSFVEACVEVSRNEQPTKPQNKLLPAKIPSMEQRT